MKHLMLLACLFVSANSFAVDLWDSQVDGQRPIFRWRYSLEQKTDFPFNSDTRGEDFSRVLNGACVEKASPIHCSVESTFRLLSDYYVTCEGAVRIRHLDGSKQRLRLKATSFMYDYHRTIMTGLSLGAASLVPIKQSTLAQIEEYSLNRVTPVYQNLALEGHCDQ